MQPRLSVVFHANSRRIIHVLDAKASLAHLEPTGQTRERKSGNMLRFVPRDIAVAVPARHTWGGCRQHGKNGNHSTSSTSTATSSFCFGEPTMMPSTGETSEKSRPTASTI